MAVMEVFRRAGTLYNRAPKAGRLVTAKNQHWGGSEELPEWDAAAA